MNKDITITITFPKNKMGALSNIQDYVNKFKDHIQVVDCSYEEEWVIDKSCVKLYGREKEEK